MDNERVKTTAAVIFDNKAALVASYPSPFELIHVVEFVRENIPDNTPTDNEIVMAIQHLLDSQEGKLIPVLQLTSDRKLYFTEQK